VSNTRYLESTAEGIPDTLIDTTAFNGVDAMRKGVMTGRKRIFENVLD
jgi:hypothetical protein